MFHVYNITFLLLYTLQCTIQTYSTSVTKLMPLIHFVLPPISFPGVATTTPVSTACLVWSFVFRGIREIPWGPMVKTLHFAAGGPGFNPDQETKIPYTMWCSKKKKKLCKWHHTVLAFLHLTYFTLHNTLKIHPCCYKWKDFIFATNIPLCV